MPVLTGIRQMSMLLCSRLEQPRAASSVPARSRHSADVRGLGVDAAILGLLDVDGSEAMHCRRRGQ